MLIRWKTVDLESWERQDTFRGFKEFDFPYSVIGAEADITKAFKYWKEREISPFIGLVYAFCHAGNSVAAFRQRIRKDTVIEHERIHADFTVPYGKESFTIKLAEFDPSFTCFSQRALSASNVSWNVQGSGEAENDHWIYLSSVPWIRFTHIVQPTDRRSGSIPRIAWGKFTLRGDQLFLPISIQTHHSLVDGLHVAQFLEQFERLVSAPERTFCG